MKICIVSELEYGSGAAIAAFRLAKSLAKSNHEVYYIFHFPKQGAKDEQIYKKKIGRNSLLIWERTVFKIFNFLRFDNKIKLKYCLSRNDTELRNSIEKINPDVINLHNVARIIKHDSIVSLGHRYPIIWTLHDLWPIKLYCYKFVNNSGKITETSFWGKSEFVERKSVDQMLLSRSNIQFVSPSRWLLNSVAPELDKKKKIHLIPYGLSQQEFFPENISQARFELGLEQNSFYILFLVSNLHKERKNIQVLLKALAKLRHLPIKTLALGNVNEEFKARYSFLHFLEPKFDPNYLRKIYSVADVFAITSLADNLPNTVLESLFCGTPVVGANVGGIIDMVIPNKTGWLFNAYDDQELANLLLSIYNQRSSLMKMSEECVKWSQNQFSLNQQRDQYLELFNQAQEINKLA